MARSGGEKERKSELDESRTDSGIDSFKSISVQERYASVDTSEEKDEHGCTEERMDSAYADSLGELMEKCDISDCENLTDCKYTEEEANLLISVTEDGDTILHLAIIHEEQSFAQQLVDLFPQELLDVQNNLYQTPLHLATFLNQPSIVRELVVKGVSLEHQDQEGNTPLHVACEHGHVECAGEMIHNASPDTLARVLKAQNWRGLACLHVTTLHKHHRLMLLLIKYGVDLNIQEGTSGKSALHMAVELHDMQAVTLLLNRGANLDAIMFNGCTPLHLAVGRQAASVANLLCRAGANTTIRNLEDETPLNLAKKQKLSNNDFMIFFPFNDIQIMGRTVMDF